MPRPARQPVTSRAKCAALLKRRTAPLPGRHSTARHKPREIRGPIETPRVDPVGHPELQVTSRAKCAALLKQQKLSQSNFTKRKVTSRAKCAALLKLRGPLHDVLVEPTCHKPREMRGPIETVHGRVVETKVKKYVTSRAKYAALLKHYLSTFAAAHLQCVTSRAKCAALNHHMTVNRAHPFKMVTSRAKCAALLKPRLRLGHRQAGVRCHKPREMRGPIETFGVTLFSRPALRRSQAARNARPY